MFDEVDDLHLVYHSVRACELVQNSRLLPIISEYEKRIKGDAVMAKLDARLRDLVAGGYLRREERPRPPERRNSRSPDEVWWFTTSKPLPPVAAKTKDVPDGGMAGQLAFEATE